MYLLYVYARMICLYTCVSWRGMRIAACAAHLNAALQKYARAIIASTYVVRSRRDAPYKAMWGLVGITTGGRPAAVTAEQARQLAEHIGAVCYVEANPYAMEGAPAHARPPSHHPVPLPARISACPPRTYARSLATQCKVSEA